MVIVLRIDPKRIEGRLYILGLICYGFPAIVGSPSPL